MSVKAEEKFKQQKIQQLLLKKKLCLNLLKLLIEASYGAFSLLEPAQTFIVFCQKNSSQNYKKNLKDREGLRNRKPKLCLKIMRKI